MKINLKNAMFITAIAMSGTIAAHAAPVNQSALAPTQVTSVKNALQAKDDAKVLLKGKVVRALGDEKYEFQDNSGTIKVEIDDELWQGKPVSTTQVITILGEVDVDYKPTKRVEIDVESIQF